MGRNVLAVITGIVTWFAIVFLAGFAFRLWPAYQAAAPTMSFDFSMKIARLAVSSVALIAAALALWRVRASRAVELAFSAVMLLLFIPEHYLLWSKFPIWYHLTFLTSLVLLPLFVALAALQVGAKPALPS